MCDSGHSHPRAEAEYACATVPLPARVAGKLKAMGDTIAEADLADDGREENFHITARHGLHRALGAVDADATIGRLDFANAERERTRIPLGRAAIKAVNPAAHRRAEGEVFPGPSGRTFALERNKPVPTRDPLTGRGRAPGPEAPAATPPDDGAGDDPAETPSDTPTPAEPPTHSPEALDARHEAARIGQKLRDGHEITPDEHETLAGALRHLTHSEQLRFAAVTGHRVPAEPVPAPAPGPKPEPPGPDAAGAGPAPESPRPSLRDRLLEPFPADARPGPRRPAATPDLPAAARVVSVARRRRALHALRNEARVADAVGGHHLPDSEPADVVYAADAAGKPIADPTEVRRLLRRRAYAVAALKADTNPVTGAPLAADARAAYERFLAQPVHLFEVKTLLVSPHHKVRITRQALARKIAWAEKYAVPFHLVALDDRRGAKRSGNRLYFVRNGLAGTVRFDQMRPVRSMADLLRLATAPADLDPTARGGDTAAPSPARGRP
jgi:hypothetical protein